MDISSVREISDLNDWLQAHHLRGFWEMIGEQTRPPEFKPFLWKWEDVYTGLTKAAEIVFMDDTGIQTGRRNLSLVNPRMNEMGSPITLGIQCLLPGEVARAHRHTPAAIRFVVKGSPNAYTVVGGEPMPMEEACEIHLLPPGFQARAHRHNSTTRYQVFRGSGCTIVDGERLDWSQGDMFVVPPWLWHEHENQSDGDAILFAMTDWPTIGALGLYREESR